MKLLVDKEMTVQLRDERKVDLKRKLDLLPGKKKEKEPFLKIQPVSITFQSIFHSSFSQVHGIREELISKGTQGPGSYGQTIPS